MFTSKNIQTEPITSEFILNRISEFDIFKMYCSGFKELNQSFKSEFYNDTNPGCRIYQKPDGRLSYKDFGTGDSFDCFSYVQRKWNLTFNECLNVILNDFGLLKGQNIAIDKQFLLGKENVSKIENNASKVVISIVSRNWRLIDYNYWMKYGISFDLLEQYDVYPCSTVYLNSRGKTTVIQESKDNPIYAYRFEYEGVYSYKIYRPLAEKRWKWLFSGGNSKNIEGFDQLPFFGKTLILTKSLKDCICFNLIGYPAISLQGEANKLENELVTKLLKRFDEIVVIYDNDDQGKKSSLSLQKQYNFRILFIEEAKDLSDLIELKGLEESKIIIDKLINGTQR